MSSVAKQKYKAYKRNKRSGWKKILPFVIILLIFIIGVSWYYTYQKEEIPEEVHQEGELDIKKPGSSEKEENELDDDIALEEGHLESADKVMNDDAVNKRIETYMNEMNLESKVGQIFMTTPEELMGVGIVTQAGETSKQVIKKYGIGGLLFSSQNFEIFDQMKLMLTSLDAYSDISILFVMNEEGATRIMNTNHSLLEIGVDFKYIENTFISVEAEPQNTVSEEIKLIVIEDQDIVEELKNGGELFLVEDGFEEFYNQILLAVRNGELEQSVLDQRVESVLRYKLENNIISE